LPMKDAKVLIEGLRKEFDHNVVAVDGIDLHVEEGMFISLLGPSGCGKTTTLRMIAGLEKPTSGRIVVDGQVMSEGHTVVPPEKRGMGMVFQSYALWPHLTVFENVAYGLKLRRRPKQEIAERVMSALKLVNMADYAQRNSTQLSGGQQQRVALARALANEPSILLLDEPLSNLDALLRETMRFEIRRLQQSLGITAIYVTHSQEEGLALSDIICIMKDGRIVQQGVPEDVYRRPKNRFVASFIGVANFLEGTKQKGGNAALFKLVDGTDIKVSGKSHRQVADGAKATILIRPENINLVWEKSDQSDFNFIPVRVENVVFTGNLVNYFVTSPATSETLRIQSTPPIKAHAGDELFIAFSPEDCVILED
jgi:ABC-type Fe3+/spermidine/putrescine transport system ATPase subunit